MNEFIGTIVRKVYDSENFKIYAVNVDKDKYKNIKRSKYKDVTITGNLGELDTDVEYIINGEEKITKYGYSYIVKNIKPVRPKNALDVYKFLNGILTQRQAAAIYREYPNIIDIILNGKDDEIDLSKLEGIGKITFEGIKNKIIENYAFADIITKFDNVLTMQMMRKVYNMYPSIERIEELLKKDPYMFFTELSGVGFITADNILIKMQKENKLDIDYNLQTSEQRCMACIMHCLRNNRDEGNTKINLIELKNILERLVPDCATHYLSCLNNDKIYYNAETNEVAIKYDYNLERKIAEIIKNNINAEEWDIDVSKYKNLDDYSLTNEQLAALSHLCKYKISILNGAAGSGKTATVSAIIKMLKDNNHFFMLLSPTGKAAQVLQDYTNDYASTIHRGLGYRPNDNTWLLNKDNPICNSVIIVDEFSMVDIYIFDKLLDAIDFKTCRLLIVGDNNQLNSVSAGNCLHDLITSCIVPKVTLSKIFRYADGGLMKVATDVRCGRKYMEDFQGKAAKYGKDEDYIFIKSINTSIIKDVVLIYKKLLEAGNSIEDIRVLSAYNKGAQGTIVINNELQKIANPNYGDKLKMLKFGDTVYYIGDIILQTKNNYEAIKYTKDKENSDEVEKVFICNGDSGVVIGIEDDCLIIKFKHDTVKYDYTNMKNITLGYAISCHKSQGSQYKFVILITPSSHTYMLNSNLIYVGMTRTQKRCYHIGDISTVNMSVKKKANLQRKTFLKDMLKEISK